MKVKRPSTRKLSARERATLRQALLRLRGKVQFNLDLEVTRR